MLEEQQEMVLRLIEFEIVDHAEDDEIWKGQHHGLAGSLKVPR